MIQLGGSVGYYILRTFPKKRNLDQERPKPNANYANRIQSIVGQKQFEKLKGSRVVDFGCGYGDGMIELAKQGFKNLIGIDIRESVLNAGRRLAAESGVADRCEFASELRTQAADAIISIDAFEHFTSPATVLNSMSAMLRKNGQIIASFGPTWYHPRGGHLFSIFPWSHLLFSESALCRWRNDFRDDNAQRFCEVEGGLNKMTILRFEQLLADSCFHPVYFSAHPIRGLQPIHNRLTREFLTSIVNCVLVKKS